ncbi:ribonuclease H-like domain-containing protein [Tanacetum coccineum]|uniref:Ribonuclease H-like domain-containing protein n=1 Tax=Tanacetum coccineum TaxID=301880 RepID=A0ABQ5AQW7_9ASTR
MDLCEVCHKAKQTREPFSINDHQTNDLGELVHLDVWGPYKVQSREGYKTSSSVLSGKSPYEMIFKTEPNLSHLKVFGCLCFSIMLNNTDKFSSSSKNKDYDLELKNLNGWNFFNTDLEDNLSNKPYVDRRYSRSDIGKGTNQLSQRGTENTGNARRGDEGYLDDSIPVEADCDNLESAIPYYNNSESEGDDTSYKEFNDQFQCPVLNHPHSQGVSLRRSTRKTSMPAKLSDFDVNTKVKYNIDRQVNYSKLSVENFNFSTSHNKISEPKTYSEVVSDIRWIEAMNQEMEALNRNVANGFNQKKGIDYKEMVSPVVKIMTVRCLLSIVVYNSWPIYQLDINNAFLYEELVEDVYMKLLEGYFNKDDNRVYDIVVTGNNVDEIKKVKEFLSSKFLIKDLGKLKYFLGIEVLESKGNLYLTQRKYCLEVLDEFGMLSCKPCGTEESIFSLCPLFLNLFVDLYGKRKSNSPPPPDVPTSILSEKVLKLNSILESLGLIPLSCCSGIVCKKEKDSDVMLVELIKNNHCPSNEELEEDDDVLGEEEFWVDHFDKFPTRSKLAYHKTLYNWIMTNPLKPRKDSKSPSGISNFTGRVRGMPIFVGNLTYASDFMIVEDISSVIDPRMSPVVLGKPFVELSNMTYDSSLGVAKFTNGEDDIAYKMPHKIEQYDSLSDMEKENTETVYFRNEEDKRKGVEYVMGKILVLQR